MTEEEFVTFCKEHGACNVDIDSEIEVSFALDLLHDYFLENPDGCFQHLRDVFKQIALIHKVTI